eukprot:jgi/Tetstr1/464038/TSEL_008843.t1
MAPKSKKRGPDPDPDPETETETETGFDYDGPVVLELGEIELELDEDDRLVVDRDDEYVDRYQSADFLGSAVSLMADYNSTAVAERRGRLVDDARRSAESDAAPCWPGCMASELDMVPVFRYDKVLVADGRAALAELERQLRGVEGFAPRSLGMEAAALRDAARFGGKDRAWRPVLPPGDGHVITVRSVIDPAERHCVLPGEACGSLRIQSGKFSRPADARPPSDRVRLLPGDRVQLVRVDRDGDEFSFEDFVPDAEEVAEARSAMSPGHADRIVAAMGLAWCIEFVSRLRAAAAGAADAFEYLPDPDELVVKGLKRRDPDEERLPTSVPPSKANIDRLQAAVDKRLAELKRPTASKKGGGDGDEVVRVYRDAAELAADEGNEDAVHGAELDDTPRGLLEAAAALPGEGRTLEERIREAADTRLSREVVADVARGGKRIEVGQRVALRQSGVEQVFMRAREEKTGRLFWALQATRAAGAHAKRGGKREACDGEGKGCYRAAPSEAEIAEFQRDLLLAASERLKRAAKKFDPDEGAVTAARNAMTDGGHYSTDDYEETRAEVRYVADRRDTYETAFRPVALPPPPDAARVRASAGGDDATYRRLAASALLAALFPRGVRLPKQMDGAAWLVRLAVPADEAYAELDAGGGTDPLRLKFLVSVALRAAAAAVLLSDATPEDAEAMLARADVTPFLESAKAADAWAAAVKKKLSAEDVHREAEAMRLRSPLLDHVAEVMQAAEDRVDDADAELLEASRLRDWAGFRPLREDMGPPGPSVAVRSARGEGALPPAAAATAAAAVSVDDGRVSAALRLLGMADRDRTRATIEAFLKDPTPDGVRAMRSSMTATFALLGKIASGEDVARFKRTGVSEAKDLLRRTAALRRSAAENRAPKDVSRDWVKLADESGADISGWMAEALAARLRTAATDVDALLERMAAAKEAIKNEKIEFFETAIDEEAQGTMAELRRLGLQTLDEQIIAYDARQRAEDREAGMGRGGEGEPEGEEGYYTMGVYDDDGGVDFD